MTTYMKYENHCCLNRSNPKNVVAQNTQIKICCLVLSSVSSCKSLKMHQNHRPGLAKDCSAELSVTVGRSFISMLQYVSHWPHVPFGT